MNEVLKVIKNRRSIRSYKPEQIEEEELDLILEAGTYAPSGHNSQPWHFTVIQNHEFIDHINDVARKNMALSDVDWIKDLGSKPDYRVTYNAPTLVIISGDTNVKTWKADCAVAIQNMLLAAESLNIGSVWLGLVRFWFMELDEVKKLGIPEGYEIYYGVSLGYKKLRRAPPPPARKEDIMKYIR